MLSRLTIFACLAALVFTGCKTPYKESEEKRKADRQNAANDPNFQAFVGRLRIAVDRKDYDMLRTMMTSDFGYRWDNPPPGDSVFAYWDLNNMWPELRGLLQKQLTPLDDFMVSPPGFAENPKTFAGYRLGLKQIMGSWRFVYFVPPPPPEHAAQQ